MRFLGKRHSWGGIVVLACLLFVMAKLPARAAQTEASATVRAGVFHFDGYHDKDASGGLTGYGIELLNMISEYSHLNFDYVGYDNSWSEMLDMLEAGDVDVVTSARKTPDREKRFLFSYPVGRNSTVLSVRSDDARHRGGDYASYEGMVIGIVPGSSQNVILQEFAAEKGFAYRPVEYENTTQLSAALQAGEIDAILTSNLRKAENERTLEILATENFYAIARKEDQELINEINYAIGQMDASEGDWANVLFYESYGPVHTKALAFSDREKAYIADVINGKKKITVTASVDRAPYAYKEDGKLKGIMPDYFAQLMEQTGMPYEVVVPEDREEYYNLVEQNGVDVVIDRRHVHAAKEGDDYPGLYTDTYMTAGLARLTRVDFSGEVKTVAVANIQGDAPLETGYLGHAKTLPFPDRQSAMQAVLDGRADAAYVYTYMAEKFVAEDLTNALQYTINDAASFEFKMYVRQESDHELLTILNKCIRQMPEDVYNQLVAKYSAKRPRDLTLLEYLRIHPEQVGIMALATVAILSVILFLVMRVQWNQRLLDASEHSKAQIEEQLAIVDALSRDYTNVYAVNLKEDTARIVKLEGYVVTGLKRDSREDLPYGMFMNRYVQERVHPEDKADVAEALSLATVEEKLRCEVEYTGSYRVLQGEEEHNFQYTFVRMEKDGACQEGTVLLGFRNVDEVMRSEQERKEALAEALAEAQHANHAKTTFLNNMSHDIRTPMNAIIGFTSLAATHIDSQELVRGYLDKIMTSSRHLLSLINDVLDMSRIESGKVKIDEKEASLPEILHDIRTIIQSDIKAKQLELCIDTLDVVNERIICDKLRLNQVLLNILSNSMKYTKPGGTVSVRIIQEKGAPDGYAAYRFIIKDTGIGMSQKFLKHLFEPFEREQTATVSGIQGTGLGLAITKNIIDMMNGTVEVKSEAGKGTEFTVEFRFRVVEGEDNAKQEKLAELVNLRALVADDDVNTCMSVSRMLSSIGMHPDWTTQGKEAVIRSAFAVEENDPYSVYIIDWMMPDMNGIEVVRRIRKAVGDTARIIILTAYDWSDVEEEAKEAGVTAFCSKPIFLSELRDVLAAPCREEQAAAEEKKPEITFEGRRLLLVEDNEINQEIAKAILEEAGFQLDVVGDGTEAVIAMEDSEDGRYDLILMDIQMPFMNGYEATRAIRAMEDKKRASIPIVAMTANAFEEDKKLAQEAGMNGHVAKPIDVPKLMETIKDILRV